MPWIFDTSVYSLLHIVVHLLLRLDKTASSVINLVLDLASDNFDTSCGHEKLSPQVKSAAQTIMVRRIL